MKVFLARGYIEFIKAADYGLSGLPVPKNFYCLDSYYVLAGVSGLNLQPEQYDDFILDSGVFSYLTGAASAKLDWNKYADAYGDYVREKKIKNYVELNVDKYLGLDNFDDVYAVGFDYGQTHRIELEMASAIAKNAGVRYKVFDVKNLLAGSSLTNKTDHNKASEINPDLPASFTAGRNLLFMAIAGSYAAGLKINDIVTGVCQTDYSGYPDCRKATMAAVELSLSLGLGAGDMRIHTPLMYLTKAETWKLAAELGIVDIIRNQTMTDYNGDMTPNSWGMGKLDNPASVLRAKGYAEALEKGWINS